MTRPKGAKDLKPRALRVRSFNMPETMKKFTDTMTSKNWHVGVKKPNMAKYIKEHPDFWKSKQQRHEIAVSKRVAVLVKEGATIMFRDSSPRRKGTKIPDIIYSIQGNKVIFEDVKGNTEKIETDEAYTIPKPGEPCIVIMSGGLDSTTLLYYVMKTLKLDVKTVLSFYYGQTHSKELECAEKISKMNDIPWKKVDVSGIMKTFTSALTGTSEIPEGHYAQDNMKLTVVPNRNSIMLSLAVGYGISVGARYVFFGPHSGDHAIYPDCRENFVKAFSRAEEIGNSWTPITILAPFTGISKADIVSIGNELGVPFSQTWSCYKGGLKHCKKCGTCVERAGAFDEAGVPDPTKYADDGENGNYYKRVIAEGVKK